LVLGLSAVEYWLGELANRSESTKDHYAKFFHKFCEFCGSSAEELLEQRGADLKSDDPKTQRRVESSLKAFVSQLGAKYSIATQQVGYAAVRSFFEMNYLPLRMRRGDYPSGESLGSRAATKEDIRVLVKDAPLRVKAIIMFLKDTGFRVSDARRVCFRDLGEGWETRKFIPIFLRTKKAKTVAKTFLGPESIGALKEYVEQRRKGTRRLPPEDVNLDSPLFRSRTPTVKPISRSAMSALIFFQAKRLGVNRGFSAHSFRKYVQTSLESAGVHPNWIDQVLAHKLLNSRDAYSLPSDQQLEDAYVKAYPHLAVYELQTDHERIVGLEKKIGEKDSLIESLLNNGSVKDVQIAELRAMVEKQGGEIRRINDSIEAHSFFRADRVLEARRARKKALGP
jgi:integrase